MHSPQNLPSNRNFGLLFAGVFALLSAYAAYQSAEAFKVYGWLAAGAAVGLVAVVAPNLLTPFNKAWMKLGSADWPVLSGIGSGTGGVRALPGNCQKR